MTGDIARQGPTTAGRATQLQGPARVVLTAAVFMAAFAPIWLAGRIDNAGTADGMGVWSLPAAIVVWAVAGYFAGFGPLGWLRIFVPFYNLYWVVQVCWRLAGIFLRFMISGWPSSPARRFP